MAYNIKLSNTNSNWSDYQRHVTRKQMYTGGKRWKGCFLELLYDGKCIGLGQLDRK